MQKQLSFEHQEKVAKWIDEDIKNNINKIVIGACCNAGKGAMMFNFCQANPDKSVLLIPHGTNILLANIIGEFKIWKERLESSGQICNFEIGFDMNSKARVIIGIPQSLKNMKLHSFDVLIDDEGHEFFFAGMIQNIIKETSPKIILIFTATPHKFIFENKLSIAKNEAEQYSIHFIPLLDLYKDGYMSNVVFDMAITSINFLRTDFNSTDDLSADAANKISNIDTVNSNLKELCDAIIKKLKSIYRDNPKKYEEIKKNVIMNNIISIASYLFTDLKKTMIITPSIAYADILYNVLCQNKSLKNNVVISHSKVQDEEFEETEITNNFKTDDKQILIVVKRGILGYDNDKLLNIVDLSFSKNPAILYQSFCRLVRRSVGEKFKSRLFFKVVPNNQQNIYRAFMNVALYLCTEDGISSYDGKNFKCKLPVLIKDIDGFNSFKDVNESERIEILNKIKILKKDLKKLENNQNTIILQNEINELKQKIKIIRSISHEKKPIFHNIESLDILTDVIHEDGSLLDTYCKADIARIEYIYGERNFTTEEIAFERMNKCKTRPEFREKYNTEYQFMFRKFPEKLNEKFPKNTTEEIAFERMNKCKTRQEFRKKYNVEYRFMLKNFPDKLNEKFPKNTNTTEEIAFERMNKCKTRSEFIKKYYAEYRFILRNFPDKLNEKFPKKIITEESVFERMNECKTRPEFIKKYNPEYCFMLKKFPDKLNEKFPKNAIKKRAFETINKCKTRPEFRKKYNPEYQFMFRKFPEKLNEKFPKKIITEESVLERMNECKIRSEFRKKYNPEYQFMLKNFPDKLNEKFPKKYNYRNKI